MPRGHSYPPSNAYEHGDFSKAPGNPAFGGIRYRYFRPTPANRYVKFVRNWKVSLATALICTDIEIALAVQLFTIGGFTVKFERCALFAAGKIQHGRLG